MVYLVTNNQALFESEFYTIISTEKSLDIINTWSVVQFDTETSGRNAHLCHLLCMQFGNKQADIQIVIDCLSVSPQLYKNVLETKLIIGQNLKFDLQFLYNYGIVPMHVYDTMIVEQLLYLGYPSAGELGGISYSLKSIAERRLKVDIDKTTRGEIIWRGLDTAVIIYAAGDVKYLEDIVEQQLNDCKEKGCIKGAKLECQFVPVIAYLEWCGIHLNQTKWKEKMKKDQENLQKALSNLNAFMENMAGNDGYTIEQDFVLRRDRRMPNVSPLVTENFDLPNDSIEIPNSRRKVHSYIKARNNEPEEIIDEVITKIKRKFHFCEVNLQGDLFSGFNTKPKCIVNWSSSRQVIQVAKWLGFNTTVQDKKTGEDKDSVLEKALSTQKGICDEFLEKYFKYQEYAKVVSSFGQGHLDAINPLTGRIHTVYKQIGASSGRMSCGSTQPDTDLSTYKHLPNGSCKYPNIQQLPSDEATRSAFVAEEGNNFISCDFSALESRLGADIYQEPAMLEEFLNGSGDMHSLCAKMVFAEELKNVTIKDIKKVRPDLRKKVKSVEFAKQFGGSAHAISNSLGCSLEEAQKFSDYYDEGFKGVTAFKTKGSKFVREHGYVLISPITGHKMYWWDWDKWKEVENRYKSKDWDWQEYKQYHKGTGDIIEQEVKQHFKAASKWDRMALNAPTQGTGACIIKLASINLFKWILQHHLFGKVKLCALVHDEICAEYPKDLIDFPKVLETTMEQAAAKFCKSLPIPAEAEVSDHWVH